MDTIITSDIFRRSQGYWQSHGQKKTWQIWSLCHENGDSHAVQNLSPSAHPPSLRWDKSFWQRPYTSAMAIQSSLQRNDIIEFQKWLHRSVWWYVVNMIWNGKDTKQQNSNIYLHGFEVPESKFLLISSSLGTSSQGVKQRILREQSIWFCCALPSYITGAPTTLANAIQSADTGSVGESRIMQGQDCIQWRWHHERHRRMSSKSHESMKFAIKDWGWFLMLGRISTLLDTGIHWTYT